MVEVRGYKVIVRNAELYGKYHPKETILNFANKKSDELIKLSESRIANNESPAVAIVGNEVTNDLYWTVKYDEFNPDTKIIIIEFSLLIL